MYKPKWIINVWIECKVKNDSFGKKNLEWRNYKQVLSYKIIFLLSYRTIIIKVADFELKQATSFYEKN